MLNNNFRIYELNELNIFIDLIKWIRHKIYIIQCEHYYIISIKNILHNHEKYLEIQYLKYIIIGHLLLQIFFLLQIYVNIVKYLYCKEIFVNSKTLLNIEAKYAV